ncbi:hypothetical protein [Synoicihabitans lomoniglobus]|uniref:Rod shape-determining protein MreD n=1 Tax=Synoicihabitans lomoniglobus TaxID=2909285 RepID=A0AAE9ZUX6_9BACT|nr:hypothetical protein [Opitutaceae bacterium LMO-M01]WED63509.1 hypothetical protein PXH66_14320 [Opitutaceae bacterium LMO-M01]
MKFQPSHRRTAVVLFCGLILNALAGQANYSLSPYAVSLWIGGLLVAFPALRLAPQQGFNASFLLGLFLDASSPLPFGFHAFLFGVAHLIIVRVRNRFAATEPLLGLVVALITNLGMFVIITFFALSRTPGASVSGLRLLTDLAVSQIAIGLTAYWFFALQERALEIVRVGLRDEVTAAM